MEEWSPPSSKDRGWELLNLGNHCWIEGPAPRLTLWALERHPCTWLPDSLGQLLPAASLRLEPTPTSLTRQGAPHFTLQWLLMLGRSARSALTEVPAGGRRKLASKMERSSLGFDKEETEPKT